MHHPASKDRSWCDRTQNGVQHRVDLGTPEGSYLALVASPTAQIPLYQIRKIVQVTASALHSCSCLRDCARRLRRSTGQLYGIKRGFKFLEYLDGLVCNSLWRNQP